MLTVFFLVFILVLTSRRPLNKNGVT